MQTRFASSGRCRGHAHPAAPWRRALAQERTARASAACCLASDISNWIRERARQVRLWDGDYEQSEDVFPRPRRDEATVRQPSAPLAPDAKLQTGLSRGE